MSESNAIQTIKDPKDPLNLKIIFDKEIFEAIIEFELIHNVEKNQIDSRLIYDNKVWFSERFNLQEIDNQLKELEEKYEQYAVAVTIHFEIVVYYERNFDKIVIMRGWKKKK